MNYVKGNQGLSLVGLMVAMGLLGLTIYLGSSGMLSANSTKRSLALNSAWEDYMHRIAQRLEANCTESLSNELANNANISFHWPSAGGPVTSSAGTQITQGLTIESISSATNVNANTTSTNNPLEGYPSVITFTGSSNIPGLKLVKQFFISAKTDAPKNRFDSCWIHQGSISSRCRSLLGQPTAEGGVPQNYYSGTTADLDSCLYTKIVTAWYTSACMSISGANLPNCQSGSLAFTDTPPPPLQLGEQPTTLGSKTGKFYSVSGF